MRFKRRVKLSAVQRIDMWGRWKAGQSLHAIGRVFGKDHVSIQFMLSQRGGIVPAARRRSALTLTLAEREDISRGIATGSSIRAIAKSLERAVSTVSREVARHGGRPQYRASAADHQAWESALRPKVCLLAIQVKLQTIVAGKLILDWSPEQISGWLKIQYPEDESMRVSHETIYRSLFIHQGGDVTVLGAADEVALPMTGNGAVLDFCGPFSNGDRIDDLTTAVSAIAGVPRAAYTPLGPKMLNQLFFQHSSRLERHSRFVALVKVPSKDTAAVVAALRRHVRKLPAALRCSLTWDRGLEMAQHKSFTVATNVKVYFCDPQSPWQRGTNENTNGLLRQCFLKRTDLSGFSQSELDKVAKRLNQRPRKTLGFETPASRLQASVASTH